MAKSNFLRMALCLLVLMIMGCIYIGCNQDSYLDFGLKWEADSSLTLNDEGGIPNFDGFQYVEEQVYVK